MISYEPGSYVDFFFVWVVCCFLHLHVFTPNWDIWACLEMNILYGLPLNGQLIPFFATTPFNELPTTEMLDQNKLE